VERKALHADRKQLFEDLNGLLTAQLPLFMENIYEDK
jgi:hypothetical protein